MPPWLPNAISVSRIIMVPVWLAVAESHRSALIAGEKGRVLLLIAILLALGGSDLLDGYIARRFDLATQLGSVLDAVADKLAQVFMVGYFVFRGPPVYADVPLWFFIVVFGRDLIMALGWMVVRRRAGRAKAAHAWHGKASSVALFLFVLAVTSGLDGLPIVVGMAMISALVVFSTASYAREGWRQYSATRSS